MTKHAWIELKYTPLELEVTDKGGINVYSTEAAQEAAHEDAHIGCWFCFVRPTTDNLDEECPGDSLPGRGAVPGLGLESPPTEGQGPPGDVRD